MIKTVATALSALLLASCFATSSMAGGTAEERSDCMSDALRLCGQFIPNEQAIAACMAKQKAKLSPACRKHFK